MQAQKVSTGIALPSHDLGTWMGVGGQHHAPAALPPGKTRYPLYRRLGGPQSRSGRVRKISPPPGFDPLTFQSVESPYTDWAIPAHEFWKSPFTRHLQQSLNSIKKEKEKLHIMGIFFPKNTGYISVTLPGNMVWRFGMSLTFDLVWKISIKE